eukprot:m.162267 g.162267  ORF g.162267 m.162267 type:complete len:194 (+) comp15200_c0_seq1:183-764(+)
MNMAGQNHLLFGTSRHALQLEGPPGDGVNVGTAVNGFGDVYRWEGDVKNCKANGIGKQILLTGIGKGEYFGEYKQGWIKGSLVAKFDEESLRFIEYENGQFQNDFEYDNNNPLHVSILHKAVKKSEAARALVCVPWSRTTNHFMKWKPMQDIVLTALLIGERLHRNAKTPNSLCALPVEIWEMILQFVLTHDS